MSSSSKIETLAALDGTHFIGLPKIGTKIGEYTITEITETGKVFGATGSISAATITKLINQKPGEFIFRPGVHIGQLCRTFLTVENYCEPVYEFEAER